MLTTNTPKRTDRGRVARIVLAVLMAGMVMVLSTWVWGLPTLAMIALALVPIGLAVLLLLGVGR